MDAAMTPGYLPPPDARPPIIPSAAAAVTVRFVPKKAGDEYFVAAAESAEPIKVPCELRLLPGKLKVEISGASSFAAVLKVPPEATATATIEHRNKGLMALGIAGAVATAVGVLMLELPAEMLLSEALSSELGGGSVDAGRLMRSKLDPLDITMETWTIVGGAVAAAGIACTAVGFALMGKTRVVLVPDTRAGSDERAPKLELVGLGVAPSAGGDGAMAGATFAF
jgi:hypothetical protein